MRERLLVTAEQLLRRHGLSKTNVVDIARELGVSHAAVYRYFKGKSALREAVAERWLHAIAVPLEKILRQELPADEKLEALIMGLMRLKRRKVMDDPELFATYHALAESSKAVVEAHVHELVSHCRTIIEEGIAAGLFVDRDPQAAAVAVFPGTAIFPHPHHVREQTHKKDAVLKREAGELIQMLLRGLKT